MKNYYDVVIIGAGPTGLIAASLLGEYNIQTLLVERNASTSEIPKAILVDDETLRVCQNMGLEKVMERVISPGGGAEYFADSNSTTPFAQVKPKIGRFGYYPRNKIDQPEFEKTLYENVKKYSSVDIVFNHELISFNEQRDKTSINLHNSETNESLMVSSRFLLGCDGGRSTVRKLLNIKLMDISNKADGSSFEEPWIILDLKNDDVKTRNTAFYCNPPRPSMHAATSKGMRRYEFMLLPGESEEEMLSDDVLEQLVAPFTNYKKENVVKKAVVRFNALIAEKFRFGRTILLGDAAHLTPPFAGQGLNSGVRDSYNLVWKLKLILDRISDESILESYEEERRDHVAAMIKLSVNMGNFILTTSKKRRMIRNTAFSVMSVVPPLKRYVTEMRFKPKPICTKGLFVDIETKEKDSILGAAIPQPNVLFSDITYRLMDYALNNNFTLLKVGNPDSIHFPEFNKELFTKLGIKEVTVLPSSYLPHEAYGETVITDTEGVFNAYQNKFILLRPDRYVAGIFTSQQWNEFFGKLENTLQMKERMVIKESSLQHNIS
ncbi:FAD-dependent monooxygenase [Psychrobacillus soli]|nr:FAD-dependent monooxygenase [Psychrobacillus soli]